MARRDGSGGDGETPPPAARRAGPARTGSTVRRSRLTEARRYHPRGQTIGDATATGSQRDEERGEATPRPALRLVPADPPQAQSTRRSAPTDARSVGAGRAASARPGSVRAAATRVGSTAGHRTGTRRLTRRAAHPGHLAEQGRRLRLGTALVLALFLVIAGRLVQFQLTDAPAYAERGLALRLQPVVLPAPRGSIVDRSGKVLAGSVEARYVFADPTLVTDPVAVADRLATVLGVPRSELLPKLRPHRYEDGRTVRFEYLARGVPVDMATRVSALGLQGIGVRRDESRVLLGHDLAANLIGFTGRDLDGLAGLEASYNDLLRGVDGRRKFEIGQPQGEIDLDHEIPGGYHEEEPAKPGHSLQLTIDQDLQFEVQRILNDKMKQVKATQGAAVVLDVRTGEVLAQASYPFFDAANPFDYKESDRGDVGTGLAVEPGSVHKAIVFAACLQEGVVTPQSTVRVTSSITKGDQRYTDTHYHSKPTEMTLPGLLAYSSNVGTIMLADRLGAEKLYQYQRLFGLGERTGEGLPGEAPGLIQPPKNWSAASYGSIPIGHGVSVTPLQMTAVYAAIANGGVWIRPHLVKSVIAPDGSVTATKPADTRRVISAENAVALRTMLEAVTTVPEATGLSARVADYRVAGKTGTGRVIVNGRAAPGEVGSFIGMAPADAPRYVISVFARTPGGGGGEVAGPAFAEMMSTTLHLYRVPPTGRKPPTLRAYP